MHKYYEWQVIKDLPFSELGGLLKNASKMDVEQKAYPFWMLNQIASQFTGSEVQDFSKFIDNIFDDSQISDKKTRSPKEIQEDMLKIVEQYKNGGGR